MLAEKYELQRKCQDLETELAHSKREAQRALAKRRNTMVDMAQADELETVQKALTREKRLRERADETADKLQRQIEGQQAAQEVDTAKVESDGRLEVKCEELTTECKGLKKENAKLAKENAELEKTWQSRLEVWTEKLQGMRAKNVALKTELAAKDKKRPADQDVTAIGTPGEKTRGRKKAKVGEKSNFSMTPYLNKTLLDVAEVEKAEPVKVPLAETDKNKRDGLKKKPRKSVVHFATFTEPEVEKKKKRKLGAGRTLFDDEVLPVKGIFGDRLVPKGSLMAGKGALSTADGFAFSPRKIQR